MRTRGRRSVRLKGRDYATPGSYYVTICVHGRRCLLGTGRDGHVTLSAAGRAVDSVWLDLPRRHRHVGLDAYVIMPNHLHGILRLRPVVENGATRLGDPLSEIVRWFKAQSTRAYIHGVHEMGWPRFEQRLWQRGYYEHVIRSEDDLVHARGYILRNPRRWMSDPDNPSSVDTHPTSPWDM